jgi:pyridoxal biosynthesis lyase PdxS
VNNSEVLRPAEAARRLGVPTRVIIQAMYEKRLPRVRLADGTLGVPTDALDAFQVSAS